MPAETRWCSSWWLARGASLLAAIAVAAIARAGDLDEENLTRLAQGSNGACFSRAGEPCAVEGESCQEVFYECCEGFENEFKGYLYWCDCSAGHWSCVHGDPACVFLGCGDPVGSPGTTPTLTPLPVPTASAVPSSAGDCDRDGRITIEELVVGVRIALGSIEVVACPEADVNGDSKVTISELVTIVKVSLANG